jgi:hypothetical protein
MRKSIEILESVNPVCFVVDALSGTESKQTTSSPDIIISS